MTCHIDATICYDHLEDENKYIIHIIAELQVEFMKKLQNFIDFPIFRQVLVALGPFSIAFVVGISDGFAAVLLPQLKQDNNTIKISTEVSSLIASMPDLPMAISCSFGGYLMEKIGRRTVHFWSCVVLTMGWILIAAAPNLWLIFVGRALCGLGDGLYTPTATVYISESAQPNIRGVLLMSITVASNIGVLFIHLLSAHIKWKIGAVLSATVLILVSIYILYLPESPIFLIKQGSTEDARQVFFQLRGISDISKKEFEKITERERELNKIQGLSFVARMNSLTNPIFWKPLLIVFAAVFAAQLTGYSAMISYAIEELQDFGVNYEYSAMITIDIFRVAATMFSCVLVRKMTRRRLGMLSGYGSSLTLFCLWLYLYISPRYNVKLPLVVMVLLIINICFIHIGLNPLSYALMGELFPMDNKSMGATISSIFCYILYYLVVFSYPCLKVLFDGIAEIFLGYSVCVLFGTICLTLFLPETKDKPLYIIEEYFKSRK